MSTLVVVRKGKKAAIASDSVFRQGSIKVPISTKLNVQKIHKVGDAYVGFTGWSAMHTVFDNVIKNHSGLMDFTSIQSIFETFQKLHVRLKEDYFIETKEKDDQPVESSQWDSLIASPYGIFSMDSYRTVNEYKTFWADGSGYEVALGALHAIYNKIDSPEEIAKVAIEAACEFDSSSGLPVSLYSVDLL